MKFDKKYHIMKFALCSGSVITNEVYLSFKVIMIIATTRY